MPSDRTRGSAPSPPGKKTHLTSCVIIPPEDVWEPIQRIRRVHDQHVRRWMPHINILYPFVPHDQLASAANTIAEHADRFRPFDVELRAFSTFTHPKGRVTLWLMPSVMPPFERIQEALLQEFPYCDDTARHEGGFTPHLSVGTFPRRGEARIARNEVESGWAPIEFTASRIQLIARSGYEKDPFEIVATIPLG